MLSRLKRKEELFSVNGLQRRPMVNIHGIEPEKPSEKLKKRREIFVWSKIERIKKERVMRGIGVVGYCPNIKCLNYERIKMVSLGFGHFSTSFIH